MGGDKKLHIGFPEKVLDKYVKILTDNGNKVTIIEQTETPRMLDERLKRVKQEKELQTKKG